MKRAMIGICALLTMTGCPFGEPGDGDVEIIELKTTVRDADFGVEGAEVASALGDLDGDGGADFMRVEWRSGYDELVVHFGATESSVRVETAGSKLSPPIALGRDVNGDGQTDLLVWSGGADSPNPDIDYLNGVLSVYHGPLSRSGGLGFDDADVVVRVGSMSPDVIDVADLSGDGNLDLVFSNTATAMVMFDAFGRAAEGALSADVDIDSPFGTSLGATMAVGDFDGDGDADLALGAPGNSEKAGGVFFFFGPLDEGADLEGVESADAGWVGGTGNRGVGKRMVNLGDLDRDGADDLLVSALDPELRSDEMSHAGRVYVVSGAPDGVAPIEDGARAILEGALQGDQFGAAIAAGDLNGDGQVDVVCSLGRNDRASLLASPYSPRPTLVFHGPFDGTRTALDADEVIWEGSNEDYVDVGGLAVDDFDGDGQGDLFMVAPGVKRGEDFVGGVFIFER